MAFRCTSLLVCALACSAGAAVADPAAQAIVGGLPAATLKAGESRLHPLTASAGDFIRGKILPSRGRIDLDLVACGDSRHVRRFHSSLGGVGDFLFVVGDDPSCLRVTAHGADATYDVKIDLRLPPAAQVAPARRYLSPAIARAAESVATGASTDAFWADVVRAGTPLIEPGVDEKTRTVTFLARGAQHNVRLFGAPGGDHDLLERLGTSDIWFKSYVLPTTTRIAYQLAADVPEVPGTDRERRVVLVATAKADPFNPHAWPADAPDAFGRKSVLELSDAPAQPWVTERAVAKGTLQRFVLASTKLGNERDIAIYRPPGFRAGAANTVLLFVFDADAYLTKVPTPTILDNMLAAGRLPPTVAVFIANPDAAARARELPGNPDFADFMAKELLPRVLRETGLRHDPKRTVLAGSSFGGLASAFIALRHPNAFGNAISLSGSFWWHPVKADPTRPEYVADLVASTPRKPVRFFLTAGLFERQRLPSSGGILETVRHLRDVLTAKGYHVTYRDYAAGHDYYVWRGALSDGLETLFGKDARR